MNWFLKQRIFEQGDHLEGIMERLQERKKELQQENLVAWENRVLARGMTAEAFRNLIKKL